MFLIAMAGAMALLPTIIAKTPLRDIVLSAAVPDDVLRVSVRDASLSWLSKPSLSGFEVKDAAGNLLLAAEKIALDRRPIELLMSSQDYGVIQVDRPKLHVQFRPDGSNLEDIVQKLRASFSAKTGEPASEGSKPPPAFGVQIVEGTILFEDPASRRRWRIDGINAQYDSRGRPAGFGQAAFAGRVIEIDANNGVEIPAGRFSITLQPTGTSQRQFAFRAEAVSLDAVEPWLRRLVVGSELHGTLSGEAAATFTPAASIPTDLVTLGSIVIDRLEATAPALAGDRLRLSRVELPWRLTSQPTGLAIEDLQLRSDVGQVALRGRLDPNLGRGRHDLDARGALDVARLVAMLPHALRIRDNTSITSGTIELAGRYQPSGDGQLITGSLRSTQLAATSAGRRLQWDEPVNANFIVRRTNGAMQVEELQCHSKFLTMDATGGRQQFSAKASFDLNSLAEQLGQFVDLSGMRLAGMGTANVSWQQVAEDQFSATAAGEISQLAISLRDGAVWSEPQLTLQAEAAGMMDPVLRQLTRVDTAKLQITSQGDALDARLMAAVGLTSGSPTWPLSIRANGRIARWLMRMRPWLAARSWQVDGDSELAASVRVSANAAELSETKLVVANLQATAPSWHINEPRVEVAGDARWDSATKTLSAGALQLVTSTLSIAARNVHCRTGEPGASRLTGAAAFRTNLARLSAWRETGNKPVQYQPGGELTGNLRFVQQGDRISGELTANGQNLTLSSRAIGTTASRGVPLAGSAELQTIWQEPQLSLRALASYEPSADLVSLDQLDVTSNTLQASARGQIQKFSSIADVNLAGTLNYDLAQVTPLLRPYIGGGVQFAGREQARFALAGRMLPGADVALQNVSFFGASSTGTPQSEIHWSRRVRAQLELPWSGANLYGLPVGAGRLAATLGDGSLRIEPLSLAVGEGRLTASPMARFDPQPPELSLPAGPLITNVRISPEVSEALLKYVAPVLAGATQSEGHFSLELEGARVPLDEPKHADSAGRLTVHSARVVPGALARELIAVAQQVESLAKRRDPSALAGRPAVTLLEIRDQQVNFRVIEGRVHHQNMEFQVGDVTLRSQGSVGFDETLALTLHVPIQDAWVAKEPLLAGLKGQSIQVPVSGTLTRPQLDQRAIASLSGQLIQNAAGNAIGGELNKALDKLFKSR
jgi:hypothetical protein